MRGDEFWLRAFWELSTERMFGQVIGPIPNSRIVQYGERKGLNRAMLGVLEAVIREMDEAWLGWQRDEQRKQSQKAR